MEQSFYFPAAITFILSVLASVLVWWLFPKIGLMDNPIKYGHQRKPIPLPGGLAPAVTLLVSLLLFLPAEQKIFGLVFGLLLVTIISFWDDRRHLPPLPRLLVHFLAAIVIVQSGIRIEYLSNPFGDVIELSTIFFPLPIIITVFWLVGFANVMNWLDGIPGLSAASATAAGLFLGILSLTPVVNQPQIALISFLFAASAAGFLVFNLPPPKMLLGDTGAMVFGFMMASISVFSGGKMATVFVVLALPMMDAAYVVLRRLLAGQNPMKGQDRLHLHDRLREVGISERQILLLFLSISVFLGWLSLQLQTQGKLILIGSVALIFLLFSWILEKMLVKKPSPNSL